MSCVAINTPLHKGVTTVEKLRGGAKNWVVGGVSHPAGGGSPEIYLFVIKLEISGFCAYSLQSGGDDNKIVTTENVLHVNLCFLRKINYRYGCH